MSENPARPSLPTRARLSASVVLRTPLEARFPFRSPAAIERAQKRRLQGIVNHAWEHVPYYLETMRRLELTPADIRTEADLAKLPIVEPDQIQRDPEYFISRARPFDRYLEIYTSGTRGEPRPYYRDAAAVALDALHFTRLLSIAKRLAGKRGRLRQVFILPPVSTTRTVQRSLRGISILPSQTGVGQSHLSMLDHPQENVSRLNELKPDVVITFGSYLGPLYEYVEETSQELHRPAAVIYGGDRLPEAARRLISEKFGVQVLSTYSATEMSQVGFECDSNRGIHVNTDLHPLRIVDSGGNELPIGEGGEVIASNLVNRGTVLLNYRLGDLARRLPDRCGCGRNLPLISLLETRSEDWLQTGSGGAIHAQAIGPLWKAYADEIRRYQLIQVGLDSFRLLIVPVPGCNRDALRAGLERKFRELLGAGGTLEVSFSESLPRTKAGKVQPVVSELTAPPSGRR
jgi:phenylacetate-CoA ligase